MKLKTIEVDAFPPLAWLAEYRASDGVLLRHGAQVETGDDYFVEGVWNGPFAERAFDRTDCFFGSGGRIDGDTLTIVPSASTVDYCYYATRDGRTTISNSLPLILAAFDDALDPACWRYPDINNSILKGINAYEPQLPTRRGEITRLVYRNLRLSGGTLSLEDKPMSPHFGQFRDYQAYLADNYALIAANARDVSRRHPMRIASTQSKGYDSTAVNAIAAPLGLDQVFSIAQGKAQGKFADQDEGIEVDDGGGEIGAVLGFECTFIDRRALRDSPQSEHLYYASLHASEDTNLAGINPHIEGPTLLLIGCLGEITAPWSYYHNYYGRSEERIGDLERADHGGHAMGEVRLSVGFVTLPFFYLGARQRRDILNICANAEMDPWRMNNNYDRPLARRIAEEGGVPRALFGQQKKATAMVFTPPLQPMGEALRQEYIDYLDREGVLASWKWTFLPLVHKLNRLFWFASPRQHRWLYYIQRALTKLKGKPYYFPIIWRHLDGVFYSFCVNKRAAEYRGMLNAAVDARQGRAKQGGAA